MAILFELWAECAGDEDLDALAAHFDGLCHTLMNGKTVRWEGGVDEPYPSQRGLLLSSPGLSPYGVRTVQDALAVTEAGLWLYHHFLTAPRFRYARIDWEAPNIPLADLGEYHGSFGWRLACIVDDELLESLGGPDGFRPFRPGYHWYPYQGEIYRPLGSSDHTALYDLYHRLFPANSR